MWGQSPNSMFWFITLQKTITSNNSLKSITKKRYILKFEDNNLVDTIILMTHSLNKQSSTTNFQKMVYILF